MTQTNDGGATDLTTDAICASGPVRALEWMPSKTSYTQANCVLGQYQITFLGEFECWQLSAPHKQGTDWKDGFTRHASKSAAKAAAQADYERRILAALTPAPQPVGVIMDGWVDDKTFIEPLTPATPTAQEAVLTEGELDEAWKSGFNAGFGEAKLTTNPPQPSEAVAVALKELLQAVCGETGFAACVRQDSGRAYPWPALDAAEAKAQAALRALKGGEVNG